MMEKRITYSNIGLVWRFLDFFEIAGNKLQYLSWKGLIMWKECLKKDYPNKIYLTKQMGENQLDDF